MVPSKFGNQLELIQLSLTSSGQHQAIRYRQSIERTHVIPGFPKQLRTSRWHSQSSCVSLKAIPYSVRCSTGPFTGVSEIKTLYLRDLSGIRLCTKDSVSPHRHQFHLQTDWVITVHSVRGEAAYDSDILATTGTGSTCHKYQYTTHPPGALCTNLV